MHLDDGGFGRAIVPLRRLHRPVRGRRAPRRRRPLRRQGVRNAVRNVNEILAGALLDEAPDPYDQRAVDRVVLAADGTDNKAKLGANATLGISMAVARAAADSLGLPLYRSLGGLSAYVLPVPMMNVLNGGARTDNDVDFQEFMVVPVGAPSFAEGLRMGTEVYHALKAVLKEQGIGTGIGDEGGFAPDLPGNEAALELLVEAIGKAGFEPGAEVALAMDPACTELYRDSRYELAGDGRSLDSDGMVELWRNLADRWPRSCRSRTAWPRTTGPAGPPSPRPSTTSSSSSRTTCS